MKRLGLLRHAKSSWEDSALADFDRPLNERGREAASAMGRELRRLDLQFDLALISPARRAIETWNIVETNWHSGILPEQEPRLYGAPAELLVAIISETDERVDRLLLVGHNPGLHHLAFDLTSAQHEQLAAKFPTGTLAEIALPIASWTEIGGSGGKLARFLRPRDLI